MASVLEDDNVFVVDNTANGFDLHSFDTGAYIRTFPTAPTSKERRTPRHVCFGENGHIVVGGGNDGKIYVFDRRSGATLDTMQHSPELQESQTITVSFKAAAQVYSHMMCRLLQKVEFTTSPALLRKAKTNPESTFGSTHHLHQTLGNSGRGLPHSAPDSR